MHPHEHFVSSLLTAQTGWLYIQKTKGPAHPPSLPLRMDLGGASFLPAPGLLLGLLLGQQLAQLTKDHLCYPQSKSGSIPITGPFWGLTSPSHGVLWKVPIWPRLLSGQPEAEFTGFPGFQHAQAESCSCRNSPVGKISAYAGFTELWGCLPAHLPMDLLRSIALFL